MKLLKILPDAIDESQVYTPCGALVLAASLECGAFIAATRVLFGEELAFRAGYLWAEALEAEPRFRFQSSSMRLVTILAAIKLADLMGAPRQTHEIIIRTASAAAAFEENSLSLPHATTLRI